MKMLLRVFHLKKIVFKRRLYKKMICTHILNVNLYV